MLLSLLYSIQTLVALKIPQEERQTARANCCYHGYCTFYNRPDTLAASKILKYIYCRHISPCCTLYKLLSKGEKAPGYVYPDGDVKINDSDHLNLH